MKIAVGSDHAGYQLKLAAIRLLIDKRLDFVDVGCNSTDSVATTPGLRQKGGRACRKRAV